ncbi:receptor-type tyrosine-protein phosphatase C-like [Ostrea edulis]|uniref:receptor-type tyrosine-protein phosphatase C-like n=1 Tax=Ostrea edulis TaxID=37623 RepID=UPI0024AEA80A|nr:receptor-type tyrosine-protein phosphatase C-like [Ostrea edulis]
MFVIFTFRDLRRFTIGMSLNFVVDSFRYYNHAHSLCFLFQSSLWLPAKNESKTVGTFTTKMTDCTQTTTVTKTSITLHQKGASGMSVCILEGRRWKGESDSSNRRVLLDLINEARVEERTQPEGRILVLSSDGAKRCGQFLVVFNALEQLTMDTEVDIFTITRQLRIRRPEFISSLEEYQFCYEAIADHLQNDTVYANC